MNKDAILEALRTVLDPEIGIDVVEMGLVRSVEIDAAGGVNVTMTMTTPSCPLAGAMARDAEATILARVPRVTGVHVEIVEDPPWDPSWMSAAARAKLGW